MTNIENALLCAGDQSANDHSLDEQMGQVLHDEAIFDRAWLALVGVADYILFFVGAVANYVPFISGRKSGATHTAQPAHLELRNHPGEVAGLNEDV